MMRIVLFTLLIVCSTALYSQENERERHEEHGFEDEYLLDNQEQTQTSWYQETKANSPNVLRAQKAFREYKIARNESPTKPLTRQERAYLLWFAKNESNTDAVGNVLPIIHDSVGVANYLRMNTRKSIGLQGSKPWKPLGPFTWDKTAPIQTGSQGTGVVRTVAIHPTNSSIVLAGTISGGVWRSTDGGTTWKETTRTMLLRYVGGIAFSKSASSIVFAATDGGVIKSTDAGATWNFTTLNKNATYPNGTNCDLVAVSPTTPNVVLATRGNQLMRSTDGGVTWNPVANWNNSTWSLQWHPTSSSIVYASAVVANSWTEFRKSTDAGVTWQSINNGYPVPKTGHKIERVILSVTPSAPNYVYAMIAGEGNGIQGLYGLYISRDNGESFEHLCCGTVDGPEPYTAGTNINLFDYSSTASGLGQIAWCMGFGVSSTDTNVIVASGIFSYLSTDGGRSFKSTPGIHYDVQHVLIRGTSIYVATDGGLYITRDLFKTINPVDGINSLEMWGFDASLKGSQMIAGAYHMPTMFRDDSSYSDNGYEGGWYMWAGADAMGANLNIGDPRWSYSKPWSSVVAFRPDRKKTTQPGSRPMSLDLGYLSYTNLEYHPNIYTTVYGCDYKTLRFMRSRDNAITWDTLAKFSTYVRRLRASILNENVLVGVADFKVLITKDGGTTWSDITPTSTERKGQGIWDVALSDTDDKKIWLILSGQQKICKVVYTEDAGETWRDYSGSLPASALRSIRYQRGTNGGVYVGTDMGIYYRNLSMSDWQFHGTELPVGEVLFLNISYEQGKIWAGTVRGIWENDLYEPSKPKSQISADRRVVNCYKIPVRFSDISVWKRTAQSKVEWSFEGGEPAVSTDESPLVKYSKKGKYSVTLTVTEDGVSNTQTMKDFITVVDNECAISKGAGNALNTADRFFYLEIPKLNYSGNNLTMSAWVKPKGIQKDWSAIAQTQNAQGFGFKNGRNELEFHWETGAHYSWNSGLIVQPDVWSHVAMVVTPDSVTLYVNGVPSVMRSDIKPMDFSNQYLRIGVDRDYSDTRRYLGEIDEFCFYTRTLSRDEIRSTMHLSRPPSDTSLLVYYTFNEKDSSFVLDNQNENNPTMIGRINRVVSTAPVGVGKGSLVRSSDGGITYSDLGAKLSLQNPTNSVVAINRISTPLSNMPTDAKRFSDDFWIIRAWDTVANTHSVVRVDSLWLYTGFISGNDARQPSSLRLFQRRANEFQPTWSMCVAEQADSLKSSALFRGCVSDTLGQFVSGTLGDSPLEVESYSEHLYPLRVYPNPARDVVTVIIPEQILTDKNPPLLEVFSSLGERIASGQVTQSVMYVNIADYPSGAYLVRIGSWSGIIVR